MVTQARLIWKMRSHVLWLEHRAGVGGLGDMAAEVSGVDSGSGATMFRTQTASLDCCMGGEGGITGSRFWEDYSNCHGEEVSGGEGPCGAGALVLRQF